MKNEVLKVENRIFDIEGEKVMLDSDLAKMYGVATKVLNQAVKRNLDRFPKQFRFVLSELQYENLWSQIVTTSGSSQNHGGRRTMPFVFTEQGVAMLSAVLKSDTAVKVSVEIMQAFVQMRNNINSNISLLQLSQDFEQFKLQTGGNFDKIFKALEGNTEIPKQGIFFEGQTYDAFVFMKQLIGKAKTNLTIIDNYIDETVITMLTAKTEGVKVNLLTKNISKQLELEVKKANLQYPSIRLKKFDSSHDRFIIIDGKEIYHLGASLKDLGNKWFAFSKMEVGSVEILSTLNELI
ncbi:MULTISPECIES: ORF6N domain-containing protein [unclassified Kaistella]|uniref:ORF6N domain-containing protein n=1 Tax=unclassified Kaistella TaxID=2762626 RepID=UPI0027353D3C|nr:MULTISPECIES: ORF6N domain-containing protein [unclassified Kaistella]MDP2454704.1 ORF6N domain-containing protein [Kaistella sp. SH11-4b]MDP2457441.1 ORF6N domain-containing protein [Kaistella sp. SH40-3]MDP2460201.1 ORF6N domain-containing protein [Kaistella sp. SH19-2b]